MNTFFETLSHQFLPPSELLADISVMRNKTHRAVEPSSRRLVDEALFQLLNASYLVATERAVRLALGWDNS